jgi:hypothetical protein
VHCWAVVLLDALHRQPKPIPDSQHEHALTLPSHTSVCPSARLRSLRVGRVVLGGVPVQLNGFVLLYGAVDLAAQVPSISAATRMSLVR